MVVAFMGDDYAPFIIYGHYSSVLLRAEDDVWAFCWHEFLEGGAAALIGAMLRPHGIIAE